MKLSFAFVVMVAFMAAVARELNPRIAERDVKSFLNQQPLLFGRRGLRPGMNSLFFGKKSEISSSRSTQELKEACIRYLTSLEDVSNVDRF